MTCYPDAQSDFLLRSGRQSAPLVRSRHAARVGPLQRIRAHDAALHPYRVGDSSRVAVRARRELLRRIIVRRRRDETCATARVEENPGQGFPARRQATKEESQGGLKSAMPTRVPPVNFLWSYSVCSAR